MNTLLNNYNPLSEIMRYMKNFSGNPKQIVESLISSGKMTQEQFKQISEQATQIQKMVNSANRH